MLTLSILIPTIKRDQTLFNELKAELESQKTPFVGQVEILDDDSETDSVGEKRNRLLERASGEYIAFFDADDKPSKDYIKLLMEAANSKCDCASLKGIITTKGENPHYFEHSIKYKEYKTNEETNFENGDIKYERFPNHISCIRSEVAKRFKFPEKNWGEDTDWATMIKESGLLKTEYYISEVLYYYNYIPK